MQLKFLKNPTNYGNPNLSDINKVVFIGGLVHIVSSPVYMHIRDRERTGEHRVVSGEREGWH